MIGLTIAEHRAPPGELGPVEFGHHRLALQLNGPVRFEVLRDGRPRPLVKVPGRFAVTPAGATVGLSWADEQRHLLANVDPGLVADVVAAEVTARPTSLVERQGQDDPHAAHLIRALHADEVAGHPSGRLFTETLARALILRLLAGYGDPDLHAPAATQPAAIRRVREYVEAHLGDDLALADLANVAGLSPYHFARTFARATGMPPHRYVVARRVERAREQLVATRRPIVAIALDLGFASQGQLHRAFRRHLGTTPGACRRGG